jgi:hypothetical protein
MILRYADGRIVKDSVELQARIWENMLEDATYGEELDYVPRRIDTYLLP